MPNYTGCRSNDFVRRDVVTTGTLLTALLRAGIKQSIDPGDGSTESRNFSRVRQSQQPSLAASASIMSRNDALRLGSQLSGASRG